MIKIFGINNNSNKEEKPALNLHMIMKFKLEMTKIFKQLIKNKSYTMKKIIEEYKFDDNFIIKL